MNEETTQLYDAQTSRQFYDERYTKGYMDEWPVEKKRRVFALVQSLGLPAEGEALDFGCGNGVFTEVLSQALPKWKIYGTDFSAVAIETAQARIPSCTFFTPAHEALRQKRYDFLFTHHVLEHVYDIQEVWREIAGLLKPGASMLHILPCGNEGSFEHHVALLARDGINTEMENRFFFEDTGHVRRLDTERLSALAAQAGFELAAEYYANQYHGAIDLITQNEPSFVLMMTDPARAKDDRARKELSRLRWKLMLITAFRQLQHRVESFPVRKRNIKRWIGLLAGLPVYPLSRLIDYRMKRQAETEWAQRKNERNGGEMYLYFTMR